MNASIISTVLITLFGIVTGLSGSSWFWTVIILFPIIVCWRLKAISSLGTFIGGYVNALINPIVGGSILLILALMTHGFITFGDVIVFIYISLLLFIIGKILGVKVGNTENISPYVLFSLLTAILGTITISFMMP